MTTAYKLGNEFMQTEFECRNARDQHEAEMRRHLAHLEIDDRMKHGNKPAKTKRLDIGVLRLNRRRKNVMRAERFDGRSKGEYVPIRHVPASREEMPSDKHVTSINYGGLTNLWPLAELARVQVFDGVINLVDDDINDGFGVLPVLSVEELAELSQHLGTGFRVFTA